MQQLAVVLTLRLKVNMKEMGLIPAKLVIPTMSEQWQKLVMLHPRALAAERAIAAVAVIPPKKGATILPTPCPSNSPLE